jgi:hypothetical protein
VAGLAIAKGWEQIVQTIGPAARVPGATRMRRGQPQSAGARLVRPASPVVLGSLRRCSVMACCSVRMVGA